MGLFFITQLLSRLEHRSKGNARKAIIYNLAAHIPIAGKATGEGNQLGGLKMSDLMKPTWAAGDDEEEGDGSVAARARARRKESLALAPAPSLATPAGSNFEQV